jgi:hypothetical protein
MIAPPIVYFHLGRRHAWLYHQYVPPLSGGFQRILFYRIGYIIGLVAGPGRSER